MVSQEFISAAFAEFSRGDGKSARDVISRLYVERFGSKPGLHELSQILAALGATWEERCSSESPQARDHSPMSAVTESVLDFTFATCPECGVRVRTERLQKHLKKAHSPVHSAKALKPPPPQVELTSGFILCPECGIQVRATQLDQHFDATHPKARAMVQANHSLDTTQGLISSCANAIHAVVDDGTAWEDCPYCGMQIQRKRLQKHLKKVHPTQPYPAVESSIQFQLEPGFTRCPRCRVPLKLTKLSKHLAKACRKNGSNLSESASESKCKDENYFEPAVSHSEPGANCKCRNCRALIARHEEQNSRHSINSAHKHVAITPWRRELAIPYSSKQCQQCGVLLSGACYSASNKSMDVPRGRKICPPCYGFLLPEEKKMFHRYTYASGTVRTVNSGRTRKN